MPREVVGIPVAAPLLNMILKKRNATLALFATTVTIFAGLSAPPATLAQEIESGTTGTEVTRPEINSGTPLGTNPGTPPGTAQDANAPNSGPLFPDTSNPNIAGTDPLNPGSAGNQNPGPLAGGTSAENPGTAGAGPGGTGTQGASSTGTGTSSGPYGSGFAGGSGTMEGLGTR